MKNPKPTPKKTLSENRKLTEKINHLGEDHFSQH